MFGAAKHLARARAEVVKVMGHLSKSAQSAEQNGARNFIVRSIVSAPYIHLERNNNKTKLHTYIAISY